MKFLCFFGLHQYRRIAGIKKLSTTTELIICKRCRKLFAINHELKALLPWDDELKTAYELIASLTPHPQPDQAGSLSGTV